jgi:phosphoribosylanthranilate isomerase
MREPENILALDELKPDIIGFIYYASSPRFVGHSFVPPHALSAKKAGVFVNENALSVKSAAINVHLDYIQLHGNESSDYCANLYNSGFSIIKAFGMNHKTNFQVMQEYLPFCDFFLFDTASKNKGGSGRQFDWRILEDYPFDKPFFLSGGIGPADAEEIKNIQQPFLYGIDLNSRFEIESGIKKIPPLKTFFHAIRQ